MNPVPSFYLQRNLDLESGIFGQMGKYSTLEHAYETSPGVYTPKIPTGKGIWVRYHSPKFDREVFRCKSIDGVDVWDRAFEIHVGNWNQDSDGCILIGLRMGHMSNGGRMICSSTDALNEFMGSLKEVDTIQIEISN